MRRVETLCGFVLLFDDCLSDRVRLFNVDVMQFLLVAFLVGNFIPVVSSCVSQTDHQTGRFIF
jgi:hypothetical protein